MKRNTVILVLSLGLVGVILIITIFIIHQKQTVTKIRNISQKNTLVSNDAPLSSEGQTTYKSSEYGFEINYPKDWVVKNHFDVMAKGVRIEPINDPQYNILLEYFDKISDIGYKSTSLDDYIKKAPLFTNPTAAKFKGDDAFIDECQSCTSTLVIQHGDHIYQIRYGNNVKYTEASKNIINSLVFTK